MSERKLLVSVVMPCFNEEEGIFGALESLVDDWVLSQGEVLVLDGGSVDGTRRVADEFAKTRGAWGPDGAIRIIDNPDRYQAFGLNAGIRAARGEFIVRADAHGLFPPGYVRNCLDLLRVKEPEAAANVGGVMEPRGSTLRQKAVALAMQHPLGVGDALFHLGTRSGFTDTVYLGTFRKSVLEEIGLYDTGQRTNEDAELNLRLLETGRKIYLDHHLRVAYFPRKTFSALARQYFAYGRGRARTTRKHRRMTSWRQIIPPVFVPLLAAAAAGGACLPLLWLFPATYGAAAFLAAVFFPGAGRDHRPPLGVRIAAFWAMVIMHISWGAGFDIEFFRWAFKRGI
jgi:succinoglycan biosynthesis protein ExoA